MKKCKCQFIKIDFLKRISRESKDETRMLIEVECLFTIYQIMKFNLAKNLLNMCYAHICKIVEHINLKFNNIKHKTISKRLKTC